MVRRALSWAVTLLALGLSGCPCDDGFPDLFYDGLQEVCDGVPCAWTVDAGDVASVESFHSGEWGVQLAVGGDLWRALPALRVPDGAMVSLLASCDEATTLVVEVDGLSVVAEDTSDEPEELILTARREPETGQGLGGVMRRAEIPLRDPVGDPVPVDALRLRIYGEGPGACVIDELHIVSGRVRSCLG